MELKEIIAEIRRFVKKVDESPVYPPLMLDSNSLRRLVSACSQLCDAAEEVEKLREELANRLREAEQKIAERDASLASMRHERNVLQKIAAERADRLEIVGVHPDCSAAEAAAHDQQIIDAALEKAALDCERDWISSRVKDRFACAACIREQKGKPL